MDNLLPTWPTWRFGTSAAIGASGASTSPSIFGASAGSSGASSGGCSGALFGATAGASPAAFGGAFGVESSAKGGYDKHQWVTILNLHKTSP